MVVNKEMKEIVYRHELADKDKLKIKEIICSSGCFSDAETIVAIELAEEHINKKEKSGYSFVLAEFSKEVLGYVCFGSIAGTDKRFDIYWIAVMNNYRHLGIGKRLLIEAENKIIAMDGKIIYIETSSRDPYQAARNFYKKNGYTEEAIISNFYSEGDHKIIYSKNLL